MTSLRCRLEPGSWFQLARLRSEYSSVNSCKESDQLGVHLNLANLQFALPFSALLNCLRRRCPDHSCIFPFGGRRRARGDKCTAPTSGQIINKHSTVKLVPQFAPSDIATCAFHRPFRKCRHNFCFRSLAEADHIRRKCRFVRRRQSNGWSSVRGRGICSFQNELDGRTWQAARASWERHCPAKR